MFLEFIDNLRRFFRPTQTHHALFNQMVEIHAVDQVDRVNGVAFGFAHLLTFGVAHEAVEVNVFKRNLARKEAGQHDHAGDPEEEDVVAGHENA